MNIYRTPVIELFTPGAAVTAVAATDLTNGQFVAVTAGDSTEHVTVTTPEAGGRVFGIAALDTDTDEFVTIERGPGRCFRLPTTATIAAGAELETDANGAPIAATDGHIVAVALHPSTGEHVDVTLV